METNNKHLTSVNEITPAYPVHPGSFIGEELKERGIKQKDFAKTIGMQATHLNALINGSRNVTPAIALKLEKGLGVSVDVWLRLQERYTNFMRRKKYNTSRLVTGYMPSSDLPQMALAEKEPEYGEYIHYKLSVPVRDQALFESLCERLNWHKTEA